MFKDNKELNHDIGLFIIRLAVGIVFVVHGLMKWQDLGGTISFFDSLGVSPFFAFLTAFLEMLCGVAFITGLFTKIAGIILAILMVFAIAFVKIKRGFISGYEFEIVLLVVSLGIAYTGSGRLALHRIEEFRDALNRGEDKQSWKDIIRNQM